MASMTQAQLAVQLVELSEAVGRIGGRTHAALVLVRSAVIQKELETAFIKRMPRLNSKQREKMFSHYGPLGSFAALIDLGYGLELFDRQTYDALHLLRGIRNEFAHSSIALTLSEQHGKLGKMLINVMRLDPDPVEAFIKFERDLSAKLVEQLRPVRGFKPRSLREDLP